MASPAGFEPTGPPVYLEAAFGFEAGISVLQGRMKRMSNLSSLR